MKVLTAPLWELAEFEEGKALLDRGKGHVAFSGLYDSQKLHMVYGLSDGFTQKIIVTFSDKRAREIGAEYGFYDRRTMVYPGKDLIFYQADVSGVRQNAYKWLKMHNIELKMRTNDGKICYTLYMLRE